MAYSELIKNFEKIRSYMREFYIYGFKSRSDYDEKSLRSYDDEKRRIESWLGDYMRFSQTAEGKNVFLSVDSRITQQNPFYKAWKAKSFTDKDITLHFILFDILHSADVKKTLSQLVEEIDGYLCSSAEPMTFDESTIRKKLKEYTEEGIIRTEKQGRRILYSRAADCDLSGLSDVLDFFSEVSPCGVIGSFLKDKLSSPDSLFYFKHHYITQAIDSQILAEIFDAISRKRYISADNLGKKVDEIKTLRLIPLKIYVSAQNGRQYLIAFSEKANRLNAYRIDYLSNVKIGEPCEKWNDLKKALCKSEQYMWGVNCRFSTKLLEHVEFEVAVEENEQHIVQRLIREKRCGKVDKIDERHYRYSADVFDTTELIPWIRTFICRITKMNFSNRSVEEKFKKDIREMYLMYGIDGGEE